MGDSNRDLNQLIEVVRDECILYSLEVAADSVFDHRFVCGDDECCMWQKEQEPDCFKRRYRRFGQTTVQIVDQNDQSHLHCLQRLFEGVPQRLNLFRRRLYFFRPEQALAIFAS